MLAVLYGLSSTWPEPELWHTVDLDQEFSRDKLNEISTFADYLQLEERLYQQLQEEVYKDLPTGPTSAWNVSVPAAAPIPHGADPTGTAASS